jgi:AraC-like DNA-binding protein
VLLPQQVWSAVLFSGGVQGLVLAVALLFNRRGRRLANVLLSLMLISSVGIILPWSFIAAGLFGTAAHTLFVDLLLTATIGPLFYFYTRALLSPDYKPDVYHVVLATVFPGLLMVSHWIFIGVNTDRALAMVHRYVEGAGLHICYVCLAFSAFPVLYMTPFVCLAWRHARRTETRLKNEYSGGISRHIAWLKILSAVLFLVVVQAVVSYTSMVAIAKDTIEAQYVFPLMRCLFVQCVAVAAFFLPEGFTTAVADLSVRSRRAPIDTDTANGHLRRLMEVMESEKLCRDEGLRLPEVAERVSLTPHVLSQLINEHLKVNFLDFVNKYRVEDAQRLLQNEESDQYKLLAIAREAGFNSKAPFNRAFKKYTGTSPSDYRSSVRRAGRSGYSEDFCGETTG